STLRTTGGHDDSTASSREGAHVVTWTIETTATPARAHSSRNPKRRAALASSSTPNTIHNVASGSSVLVARRLSRGVEDSAAVRIDHALNASTGASSGHDARDLPG